MSYHTKEQRGRVFRICYQCVWVCVCVCGCVYGVRVQRKKVYQCIICMSTWSVVTSLDKGLTANACTQTQSNTDARVSEYGQTQSH